MKIIYTSDDYEESIKGWIYGNNIFKAFSPIQDAQGLAFQSEYNANFFREGSMLFYIDDFGTYINPAASTAELISKALIRSEKINNIENLIDEIKKKIIVYI